MITKAAHVLALISNPSNFIRMAIKAMLKMKNEVLIEILIQKNRRELTKEDRELLEMTKQEARKRIERGRHHLFCYILGESGNNPYPGLQHTYRRAGDLESCAEVGSINGLNCAQDVPVTAVTIHYMPIAERESGGVETIVPPCLRCAGRFQHLARQHGKDFEVIIYHNGELMKLPASLIHLLPYPHGYNADGTST